MGTRRIATRGNQAMSRHTSLWTPRNHENDQEITTILRIRTIKEESPRICEAMSHMQHQQSTKTQAIRRTTTYTSTRTSMAVDSHGLYSQVTKVKGPSDRNRIRQHLEH